MNTILFATDFTSSCENAFKYLKEMTVNWDVKIHLVQVGNLPSVALQDSSKALIQELQDLEKKEVIAKLEEWMQLLEVKSKGEVHAIRAQTPSSGIVELANSIKADFIVTGLRQKYSLFDRLMGSTTEQTIRKSTVPVLTIPSLATYSGIKSILFPSDISFQGSLHAEEEQAIRWLRRLFEQLDHPKVHLIHVRSPEESGSIPMKTKPLFVNEVIIKTSHSIHSGISDYLSQHQADLIAIYKPHRSIWERLYHHSLTRKLLFQAKLPLIIF